MLRQFALWILERILARVPGPVIVRFLADLPPIMIVRLHTHTVCAVDEAIRGRIESLWPEIEKRIGTSMHHVHLVPNKRVSNVVPFPGRGPKGAA